MSICWVDSSADIISSWLKMKIWCHTLQISTFATYSPQLLSNKKVVFISVSPSFFECSSYASIGLLCLPFCQWKRPTLRRPHDSNLWGISPAWKMCFANQNHPSNSKSRYESIFLLNYLLTYSRTQGHLIISNWVHNIKFCFSRF